MNQTPLLEKELEEISKQIINNHKQQLTQHENTLLALIKELTQIIKENMNNKKITKVAQKA